MGWKNPDAAKYYTCPSCGYFGRRSLPLCTKCRPENPKFRCACGRRKARGGKECNACYSARMGRHEWTDAETECLRSHYPDDGPAVCAQRLGLSEKIVVERANVIGVKLTSATRRRLSREIHGERMRTDNPSRRPGAAERMRAASSNPTNVARLLANTARLQRTKPSGLERRLWAILDSLGIAYESQVLLKPSFVVDVRVGRLMIEADGDYWHGHPRFEPLTERQQKQQARDRSRDAYLRACGYVVVRIWESDMNETSVRAALALLGERAA